MNIKKVIFGISVCVLTVLPSSRELDRDIATRNLVDLWMNPSNASNLRIREIQNTDHQPIQRNFVADLERVSPPTSSASGTRMEQPGNSSYVIRSMIRQDSISSYIQANMAYHSALSYQKMIMRTCAAKFVQDNKLAHEIYQNINVRLQEICKLVYAGNMHNRDLIKHNLAELRTAYDRLCGEYSQARLDLARKDYERFVSNRSLGESGYAYGPSGERITYETMQQQLAMLERDAIAVDYLKSELNNLIDGLELSLYKKGGGFLEEPTKEFDALIAIYQNQYAPGNRSIVEIEASDQTRFARIKGHRSNVAIESIKQHLADGNLAAAEQVVRDYEKTRSRQKYKRPVRECLRTNPELNELGIPRICAETNPRWHAYKEQLLACPENKSVIAQHMYQEHVLAQNLCKRVGIENASPEQIQQAHLLLAYKNDTVFLDHAGKALRDSTRFTSYLRIFEQRADATTCIQDAVKRHPGSARIFRARGHELLCYAGDPEFAHIINEIAYDPSCIQEMRELLLKRNNSVLGLQRKLEYEEYPSPVMDMAYTLINARNNTEQITRLGTLAIDGENRDMYCVYYDQDTHLPRIYTYEDVLIQDARGINLPDSLGTQEYSSERTLYAQVMVQPIISDMQREQVYQYLQILKPACSAHEHQDAYRALSHFAGQTYLNPAMQSTETMRRQNIALLNTIKNAIDQGDIITAANTMSMLQQEIQQSTPTTVPGRVQNFIQQHATLTVAETSHTNVYSTSSNTQTNNTVLNYNRLLTQVQTQHAAMFQQTGALSEYHRSRENALAVTAAGDLSIHEISYTLSPQACKALEDAGMDVQQFTACTGNALQQDTHAKFVQTLNTLASTTSHTVYNQQIKEGATDCINAGVVLNKEGYVQEAMYMADIAQMACDVVCGIYDGVHTGIASWLHVPDVQGREPVIYATEANTSLRHAVAQPIAEVAYEVCASAETATNVLKALGAGAWQGCKQVDVVQALRDIYTVAANLGHGTARFASNLAQMDTHLKCGNYDAAEAYCQENNQLLVSCAQQIGSPVINLLQTIDAMQLPQSAAEWERAAYAVGQYASKNAIEQLLLFKGIQGAGKIIDGLSYQVQNIGMIAQATKNFTAQQFRHLALVMHFEKSFAHIPLYATLQRPRVELVRRAAGAAIQPHVLLKPFAAAEYAVPTTTRSFAAAMQTVSSLFPGADLKSVGVVAQAMRELGISLGSSLVQAKPGFLQLPGSSADAMLLSDLKTLMRTEVEQYGAVTLPTAQNVWDNSQEFKELNIRVEKLSKLIPDIRIGEILSDDASLSKVEKVQRETAIIYEQIRQNSSDVSAISKNVGIDIKTIKIIKDHVFNDKHILQDGIMDHFAPCENAAAAWNRLATGEFIQSDLRWLQHEFAESLLMNGQEISWAAAHHTVNRMYNWIDNL